MRKEGIIEDLDPREPIDAILNLVITDKKMPGKIRIKVDATPINKGAKMNKLQVKQRPRYGTTWRAPFTLASPPASSLFSRTTKDATE